MEPTDTGYSLEGHVEGRSRRLDAPLHRLELSKELAQLREGPWESDGHGHHAKTLVKHDDLRVVLIAFQAGARMGAHRAPGRVSLQTLEGRVRVVIGEERQEVPAGGLLAFDGTEPHDVEALEESALLLTLAWPARK